MADAGGRRSREGLGPLLVCGVVSTVVVFSTFSTRSGLGDAPESVAGAGNWGVLHAPGYVVYSLLAAAADLLVPFGSSATALNALSAAATVAAAIGLFDIGRRTWASPMAAAIGAIAWVSAASVWFYSGYAKHDAVTMAWIILIIWAMSGRWTDPSGRRVAVVGVLLGASLGLGWPPVLSGSAGVLMWAWQGPRARRNVALVLGGAAVAAALVAILVLWRSAVDPDGWGGVNSAPLLWRLWTMADFGTGTDPTRGTSSLWGLAGRPVRYAAVIGRDLGPIVAMTGMAGLLIARKHQPRATTVLIAMAAGNLAAVLVVLDIDIWGFRSGIVQGGFVAPITVTIALGLGPAVDRIVRGVETTVGTRLAWAALATAVLVPGLVTHRGPATQLSAPVADRYGRDVLEPLPQDAVVLAATQSSSFPLLLAQEQGVRPDVRIVAIDGLATDWYREDMADALGRELPDLGRAGAIGAAADLARDPALNVALDAQAQTVLRPLVAYRIDGLTATVVVADQTGAQPMEDRVRLLAQLAAAARRAGVDRDPARGRWPNDEITRAYFQPIALIAQASLDDGDLVLARRALEVAASIEPSNEAVRAALDQLR